MKLSWHFQFMTSWAKGLVNAAWVKVMDPPPENPFPNSLVIGRLYIGDALERSLVWRGSSGAEEYWALCLPHYEKSPYVHAWECVNEPDVSTPQAREALVSFTRHWLGKMHKRGLRGVSLNLSVGWPHIGEAVELAPIVSLSDYVGLHEYAAPTMQTFKSWWCLRYRRTVGEWRAAGVPEPQILIGECGIDDGKRQGWKTYAKREEYQKQLEWYNSELEKDNYILSAFVFTSGPNQDWIDFDFDETHSRWLNQQIAGSVETQIGNFIQGHVIPQNPNAAFYKYGYARGWTPISGEAEIMLGDDGDLYWAQAWYTKADNMQHIVYCRAGEWDKLRVTHRKN